MSQRKEYIESPLPIKDELLSLFHTEAALTIFDVGACEGEDSIRYAKLFPNARIYSFEPNPNNIALMREHFRQYGKEHINIVQEALSDSAGETDFYLSSGSPEGAGNQKDWNFGNKSSSLLPPGKIRHTHSWLNFDDKIRVKTTTISEFCRANSLTTIDFIHMDVQGAELKVLNGAAAFLSKIKAVWLEVSTIELYKNQALKKDIEKFMIKNNFSLLKNEISRNAGDQLYINNDYFSPATVEASQAGNTDKTADKSSMSVNERGRVEWLENTLKKIPAGSRILDAGAGEQQFRPLCSHLEYVSQDFAQYKPEETGNGLQMPEWNYGKLDIVSDITAIPEADASFDAIMCTEVFEHIPDPIAAIKEFSRLLKPGGFLVITAPFCSMTHFAPYHYYSGFNRYFYEQHLPAQKIRILEMSPNGNYFEYLKQEMSRIPGIADKYNQQKPNFLEQRALAVVYKMLARFSGKSASSGELLNFGFHIFAQKE